MTPKVAAFNPNKLAKLAKLASLIILTFFITSACAMNNNDFDKEKWRIEGQKDIELNKRWEQSEELRKTVKIGMSRPEILTLLGLPDSSTTENGIQLDTYFIGIPSYGIDMMMYNMEYQENKLVSLYFTRD